VRVFAGRSETLDGRFDYMTLRAVAWREARAEALRLAGRVALLVTARDAEIIGRDTAIRWQDPKPLPWQQNTVLLIGECST
jgi:hypothetical protein